MKSIAKWMVGILLVCMMIRPVAVLGIERHVPLDHQRIQWAIDACNEGDEVVIAPGVYAGEGNCNLYFKVKNITVRGTDPANPAVVEATVIQVDNNTISGISFDTVGTTRYTLSGLSIVGGKDGIYCQGTSPTITHCVIRNCARYGIYCVYDTSPAIKYCTIRDTGGGAVFAPYTNTVPLIDNSIILNNHSVGQGGGLVLGGPSVIRNCLIVNNTAAVSGGGIHCCPDATPVVCNCTIVGNVAGQGGGVQGTNATVRNSIIRANGANPVAMVGGVNDRVLVTYSDVEGGWPGEGNIDQDPQFADTTLYHLQATSPCINAGDRWASYTNQTDIDDHPRVANGRVDMGADERELANRPPVAVDEAVKTSRNTKAVINVLTNDGDPDYDPLTVAYVSQGLAGAVVALNGDQTVTYTPEADFSGDDRFTYTISDTAGATATGSVLVHVLYRYALTAQVSGGHGTVDPAGGNFDEGTVVTLTATPEAGYAVANWTGTDNDSSTATTNSVTLSSDRAVLVTFVNTNVSPGGGTGDPDPNGGTNPGRDDPGTTNPTPGATGDGGGITSGYAGGGGGGASAFGGSSGCGGGGLSLIVAIALAGAWLSVSKVR